MDLSDPDWKGQLTTVNQLLDSLESKALRRVVANQIDRCGVEAIDAIRSREPNSLFISATRGDGLQGLKRFIECHFFSQGSESRGPSGDDIPAWTS